jgi:hypothetical protein
MTSTEMDAILDKAGKKEKRAKVQFDLSADAEKELDELQELSGSTTRVDVIRRAILFYSWFIHDVDPSSTLQVVSKEGKTITSFPARLLKGTIQPT